MDAFAPRQRRLTEVIDLVSSDDDEPTDHPPPLHSAAQQVVHMDADADSDTDSDADSETYATRRAVSDSPVRGVLEQPVARFGEQPVHGGTVVIVDGQEVFIPDEHDAHPPAHTNRPGNADVNQDREVAFALENAQMITADACLQRVLDIFPDISHDYVYGLYNDYDQGGDYETLPGQARLDNIIEQLVSAMSYPKQEKGKKRKREDSMEEDPFQQWEREDRAAVPRFLKGSMQAMLKAEFPDIPVQYIADTLATQRHLYQAFITLAKTHDGGDHMNRPYGRGRPSTKIVADATTIANGSGWPELLDELNAARKRVQAIRSERAAEEVKKLAEQENVRRAIAAGETAECSACFDDLPMNRQIHCNGSKAHFLCFDCAETYIKSEIGESRCRVICPGAECGSGYASHQLNLLSDKQSLDKLAQLQQEKDIRDAGLDDLEECPFCDYKAILPPVEEDFEFRCANAECEKVSCRRCKAISHIPVSCEQHAKDNKINSRHKIEEAMTAALVRSCNKCKKQFIKEYGCNKMTCPSCGNLQCYVCSATLKDYNHFDQNPGRPVGAAGNTDRSKLCPLYDNVEERHEREVKEAEAKAREQVVHENPDVSVEDLEIKVSEAVKSATASRIRQGGEPGGAMAFGFPQPPPPIPGVFRAFDGAYDDDDDLNAGAWRPLPRGNAAAARRRRVHDALLQGRNEADQIAAVRAQVLHPPPLAYNLNPNPPRWQAGPIQGQMPGLVNQVPAPAQPPPDLAAHHFGPYGGFAVPNQLVHPYNWFQPLGHGAYAMNRAPAANGLPHLLNNGPVGGGGLPQGLNPGDRPQGPNMQRFPMFQLGDVYQPAWQRAQQQAALDPQG